MKTVLITGANRGLGLELAEVFSAAGFNMILHCRSPFPGPVTIDIYRRWFVADEKVYCPVHMEVQGKIAEVQRVQSSRPCQENTEKIRNLEKMDVRLEKDSDAQWVDINQLKRMVYMGAGATAVLAFLGSIIGGLLKK